jgi:hypothetical protein
MTIGQIPLRRSHDILADAHERVADIIADGYPELSKRHRKVAAVYRGSDFGSEPPPASKPRRRKKGGLYVIPGGAS